ncbi:MAG: histidine phosphatase family protein [Bacteroidetes bacterium]|nr:histidine phosphatase family protein [Bacteroidota bacterium]
MKTLHIIRHAKSAWDQPGLPDHDRPLLRKGEKRTKKVADYLLKKKITVDLIISSSAVRAYETAKIIANTINYPLENIKVEPKIYYNDFENLFDLLYKLPDEINSVMMFGHNPAITQFANYFIDTEIECMHTSEVVSVSFKTNKWNEIDSSERITNFVIYPKML